MLLIKSYRFIQKGKYHIIYPVLIWWYVSRLLISMVLLILIFHVLWRYGTFLPCTAFRFWSSFCSSCSNYTLARYVSERKRTCDFCFGFVCDTESLFVFEESYGDKYYEIILLSHLIKVEMALAYYALKKNVDKVYNWDKIKKMLWCIWLNWKVCEGFND